MGNRTLTRQLSVLTLTAGFAGLGHTANAQGFVSPFIGYNFGGDAGCPQITNCKDKHASYGVAFGAVGSVVGAELAYTNDFFGQSANQSSNVHTDEPRAPRDSARSFARLRSSVA
jgi:hypothetical protein